MKIGEEFVHYTADHGISVGDVVYDTEDELYFEVTEIGNTSYMLGEYGFSGVVFGTDSFHWNYIHMTRKLNEGEVAK